MYKASSYWHVYITGPSVKSNSINKRLMIINTSAGPVSCYCLICKSLYYTCFDNLRVLILYLHKWLLDVYKCVKCHQYYCKHTQAQISILFFPIIIVCFFFFAFWTFADLMRVSSYQNTRIIMKYMNLRNSCSNLDYV